MINDSYKTVRVSLRPPRVACLINANDANWQTRVHIAVESFSRIWGGAYFIVVPTDGKTISKTFWQILLAYDPDYLWNTYCTNDKYEEKFIISDELADELKLRLAPFHYEEQLLDRFDKEHFLIRDGTFPNFSAQYPFTDISTILPNCEHPSKMLETSGLDGLMKFWVSTTTGILSTKLKDELGSLDITTSEIDYNGRQSELFNLVVKGIQGNLEQDDAAFPFAYSLTQLVFARSLKFHHWQEATLIVVGDTLEDFCLYYCLSRMRKRVAWLLPSWLPDGEIESVSDWYDGNPLGLFTRALRDSGRYRQSNGSVFLMSASVLPERIGEIRELFNHSRISINIEEGLPIENDVLIDNENYEKVLSSSLEWLLRYPTRVFERDNFDKVVDRHFINSEIAGSFETPKPKNFSKIDSREHHWINDVSILNQQFPRHPLLGKEIVKHGFINSYETRSGRESIAYFSPKSGYITDDIDQSLIKPNIRLPNALDIFQKVLRNVGYNIEISDKGRFALTTISKFGSVASLAYFLLSEQKRAVFEKYVSQKPKSSKDNKTDVNTNGLYLKSDNRWYLDFAAIKSILQNDHKTSDFIYDLTNKSVLHRGLILKCFVCRSTDWFGISELTNEFQCKRCGYKQIYGKFNSLNKLEPGWYYKLDEIVYKAMSHNFVVPLLSIFRLQEKAESFDYAPELELLDQRTNEQLLELDICCIADGKLTIGEAKTANSLGKTSKEERVSVAKYYQLAEKIGASQVVFATASEQWREETEKLITERFSNSLTKVILWNKNNLFGNQY